uniref:BPTI/Kunitz inhibitor domain-containing protein n=1 Tax=Labrus bergylta TaxID=56723 RepID=A0A3Q3FII2_9LABR
ELCDLLRAAAPGGVLAVTVCSKRVCVLLSAQCLLRADTGIQCEDYVQVWFFDKDIGACSPFWFGGCGGNANRFKTENECFLTCDFLPKPELVNFASKAGDARGTSVSPKDTSDIGYDSNLSLSLYPDACFQPQNQGDCQNYTMVWFFDTEQNECSRFWYGGCGGNGNRFKTQEACESLCLLKSKHSHSLTKQYLTDIFPHIYSTNWL